MATMLNTLIQSNSVLPVTYISIKSQLSRGKLTILLNIGFFESVAFSIAASYTLKVVLPPSSTLITDAELPHL